MPTITAGGTPQTINLPEGRVLNIVGVPGTVGVVYRLDQVLGGTNSLQSWAVAAGVLAPIGPFSDQQRFLVSCQSGSVEVGVMSSVLVAPRWTGPVSTGAASRQSASALRYEALSKPMPCSAGNLAFNVTALSSSKFTATVQKEEEAHFDAVRLVAVNRAANAIGAISAVVGTSERIAAPAASGAAMVASPVIGGTAYPSLQGNTDVNGFRSVTWNGGPSGAIAAANFAQQIALSDWIAKSSIDRVDIPGARPLSLVRAFVDGTVTPTAFMSNYPVGLQAPTTPMRGRVIQSSNTIGVDGTAVLGVVSSAAQLGLEVYPILRYRRPVFSVWIAADSLGANDGLVSDKVSNWTSRACYDLSTPDRPVVPSNMAASNQSSQTYIGITRAFLAAGVPAPSCLIVAPASVNDAGYDLNFQERHCSQALECLRLAADYKIPFVVMYGLLPNDGANLAQDNIRKSTNAKLRAIATASGAAWLDFAGIGDGASPERWVAKYKFDTLHFNELAIEEILAPALRTLISGLI